MTKPESGLFKGTPGIDDFYGNAEKVIASRVKGLDLTPHPITNKQLSSKKMVKLNSKIESRTATREEYTLYMWNKRFKKRRRVAVKDFWTAETVRLMAGEKGTRERSSEQREEILKGQKASFNGRTLQGHHTYSAAEYPHLANNHLVIFPATHDEHLKGWHGGNYRKSKAGKRIRRFREF